MPQTTARDTRNRREAGQRVKGPHVLMDLPFWDECFSTSPLYSKPSADWNKKWRTVSHPEGQDGSQPPSPGARVLPAPCLVLQNAEANTTAPQDEHHSPWTNSVLPGWDRPTTSMHTSYLHKCPTLCHWPLARTQVSCASARPWHMAHPAHPEL